MEWDGQAGANSSRSASRPTCRISRAGAPASSERRIPTRDVRCSDVPTLNFPTPHFHNRVVPGLRCHRMAHHMTGSQKVLMPGGSGSRYHPCTASSRDGRRLAPTVSPSMGSGWHQVALALPLARITGMQVTPAQCRPLAVTRLRAGGRGFTVVLRVPAGGGPPSVPPSAPLSSNIPQDTNGGVGKGIREQVQPVVHTPAGSTGAGCHQWWHHVIGNGPSVTGMRARSFCTCITSWP
jgi:hypothetical protein